MNTFYDVGLRSSRNNEKNCSNKCNKHENENENFQPECRPNKTIFRCNNITGASGIAIVALGDTITPRNIGSVSVQGLHCLRRPCIKIDVTAMLTFSALVALGTTITFRIFKRCDMGNEVEVQSFDIVQGLELVAGSSMPVSFSICDCDIGCFASDCCVYRVTVEATAAVTLASAININQGTISAIAADVY